MNKILILIILMLIGFGLMYFIMQTGTYWIYGILIAIVFTIAIKEKRNNLGT